MKPLLSILIPTTPDREKDLSNLLDCISEQKRTQECNVFSVNGLSCLRYWDLLSPIEILVFEDAKIMAIGEKRELLYKHAKGAYSIQVDSDDLLAPNAIELILEAIKINPEVDVISFEEFVSIDGREYKSNHSATYSGWEGDGNTMFSDGFHFHRTPFFKDVIRTELAKSVPIVHCRFGEDNMYADALKPLIQSEIHIPEPLYRYIHISTNPTERYGLDK